MLYRLCLGALVALFGLPAMAADVYFCWIGANGYSMTGKMRVPDAAMAQKLVTEDDVLAFTISGYANERFLGSWDMATRDARTTWHLRFDPATMTFLTGGSFSTLRSQGWNANGNADDCGSPGFGFNSGNYAQDICVNGTYIADSSIDPDTPFIAGNAPYSAACQSALLTGKRGPANH